MPDVDAVELFGGPGGWALACQWLGITEVGIEWDKSACATREAAGHKFLRADVAATDPAPYGGVKGLIASPPCTLFSQAGSGIGRRVLDILTVAVEALFTGRDHRQIARDRILPLARSRRVEENARRTPHRRWTDAKVAESAERDAATAVLVLEPARWIAALDSLEWLAFEQVPPVLPLWQVYRRLLRARGWSCWTGLLQAADYGVPQTRERAILIGLRGGVASPPEPTHSEHGDDGEDLFGGGRHRWMTMAEGLGWGMTRRPYPTIACSRSTGGPDMEKVGGSRDRAVIYGERDAGRWRVNTGRDWKEGGTRENAQSFNPFDRCAPTIDGKGRWHVEEIVAERLNDQTGTGIDLSWPDGRPSTTIASRGLVPHPGANDNRFNDATKSRNDGIRINEIEAATLQGFPAAYPWQGNRSAVFQQIGNAVPPPLAAHILAAVTGLPLDPEKFTL